MHFTGTVRLATSPPELASPATATAPGEHVVAAEDIYRIYFHGPAYQVLEQAWANDGQMVGRFASGLPPAFHPESRSLATAPRLLELAFQTAGMWEIGTTRHAEPASRIGQVVFATGAASEDPITAWCTPATGKRRRRWSTMPVGRLSSSRAIGPSRSLALDDELVAPVRRACGATG